MFWESLELGYGQTGGKREELHGNEVPSDTSWLTKTLKRNTFCLTLIIECDVIDLAETV